MSPIQALFNNLATLARTKIEPMFNTNVEVTIIVRVPGNDEEDVLVTSDSLDEVLALVERSKKREAL